MNANFIETNPIPVKASLAMMGMINEVYRLPLVPMGSKNKKAAQKNSSRSSFGCKRIRSMTFLKFPTKAPAG